MSEHTAGEDFNDERGAALIDVVCSTGLIAVLAGMAVPMLQSTRERDAAITAARFLANRFQHARVEALKRNASVAVRFDPDDLDRFAVYADGDGDGVLERDIANGTDVRIGTEDRLSDFVASVGLRINQEVVEPEGGPAMGAGSDPLRVGHSTLVSFSPLGGATSGTVYLAGVTGPQMAIRMLGATGRMRVLRFDAASGQWRDN